MIARSLFPMFASVILVGLVAGCQDPGSIDDNLVTRYQAALADRGPQPRVACTGIDSLRPTPGKTGPAIPATSQPGGRVQVPLTLDEAVMRTVANSLDIRIVAYDPAVAYEQMVAAAAAFDYVAFGGVTYQNNRSRAFGTFGKEVFPNNSEQIQYQAGVKQHTVTGANVAAALTTTENWNQVSQFGTTVPNWSPALQFQIDQPLLRNAWADFNLSQLHIAQVNQKISEEQFRQKVEETVAGAITLYWQLAQTRRNVVIQEALLASTRQTLATISARLNLDATMVEYKQTEAAVAARLADLYRAQKLVTDVQDQLARLMADSQMNLLDNYEIVPLTSPADSPIALDATDLLVRSLECNPQLAQARLAIAVNEINVRVAENQTLPKLDFTGQVSSMGLAQNMSTSYGAVFKGRFITYQVGLEGEYPLGNRAALANLRGQQLTKTKSIVQLQNAMDQVAVLIRERIRQVHTTLEQMTAQREAVDASRIQLKALDDTEKYKGRLSPEFLQVKLQAQQSLASAEQGLEQAIADYNTALSDLKRVTGTILKDYGVQICAASGQGAWPAVNVPKITTTTTSVPSTQNLENLPDAPVTTAPAQ